MKVEYRIMTAGAVFYLVAAIAYGVWTAAASDDGAEWVGTVGLGLTCGLALLVGFYLYLTGRRVGERPEDRLYAEVEEGAGELGFFSPHSVWPLAVGAAASIIALGLVFGAWLIFTGFIATGLAVVGFVFEYYRGEHAH